VLSNNQWLSTVVSSPRGLGDIKGYSVFDAKITHVARVSVVVAPVDVLQMFFSMV